MHVLTPDVMDLLEAQQRSPGNCPPTLSSALAELSRRSDYFALEDPDARYDLGDPYGLFAAQLALALAGRDRSRILARVLDLVAQYEPAADRNDAGVTA
jgi:UTP-glucose-1-phosphate uridylyltransferase